VDTNKVSLSDEEKEKVIKAYERITGEVITP